MSLDKWPKTSIMTSEMSKSVSFSRHFRECSPDFCFQTRHGNLENFKCLILWWKLWLQRNSCFSQYWENVGPRYFFLLLLHSSFSLLLYIFCVCLQDCLFWCLNIYLFAAVSVTHNRSRICVCHCFNLIFSYLYASLFLSLSCITWTLACWSETHLRHRASVSARHRVLPYWRRVLDVLVRWPGEEERGRGKRDREKWWWWRWTKREWLGGEVMGGRLG